VFDDSNVDMLLEKAFNNVKETLWIEADWV